MRRRIGGGNLTNRFDELKEACNYDITGQKYTTAYSDIIRYKGRTVIIHGFPACPECHYTLLRLYFENAWYCTRCRTEWSRVELVEAIENESALMTVSIRELSD